jgi:hypothetical protein
MHVNGKEIQMRGRFLRTAFLDGEGYQSIGSPDLAIEQIQRAKRRPDIFTFIQTLSDTTPHYSFPMELDNFAALRVQSFEHWTKHQIDGKSRNMVRKAEKSGVVVREVPFDEGLLRGIQAIYDECPVRQGRRFGHYGRDLDSLRKIKSTFLDRSVFIGAFLEETLIGFAKLVANEDDSQAGFMHILAMLQHRDKAVTNALIAQAVRSCAERKIAHLWYANFSYGKKEQDSLADFKRRNGFQKVFVPRYYVPLTLFGKLALKFGLQHGVGNWIPESIAGRYRQLRSSWYTKRLLPVRNI